MCRVTKEQINAAKQMTAIEFLWKYRPGELVKTKSREEYELREHDSFKINERTSFWHIGKAVTSGEGLPSIT